ncbi:hypothetical protein H8356DRAFT_1425565 [Neocallimastix lanati (nom. inval.)]|nr:hypothetical protein H8356DRAFT_1425565 [Neocallimastix sp. JGI-2020a]
MFNFINPLKIILMKYPNNPILIRGDHIKKIKKYPNNIIFVKTIDPKVDTAIDKLNRLKKYIKQTEDNQFAFVSKDAKLKGDKVVLKQKLNLVSDSLSSNSKDIECLYLTALENSINNKAIRHAEGSVYNYNTVRIEMDITTQMIVQTKQKLSNEINGSQEYRQVTLILREHEQFYKIKSYSKFELLETKCKDDISYYLQSVYDSMNIFYHQTVKYFPEKTKIHYKIYIVNIICELVLVVIPNIRKDFLVKQAGGKRNENLNDILLVIKFRSLKCELFIYVKEGHI